MRIITLEEHYLHPGIAAASAPLARELSPDFAAAYDHASGLSYSPSTQVLQDLGDGRIAEMDAHGISMQVLSCLTTQLVPADVALELVRSANNLAAAAVHAYPDRFAAFAALPTTTPDAAATELARCIDDLGFVGAMINGRTDGEFLDAPRFDPILATAAARNVPIYLHPAVPPRETTKSNYSGLAPLVTARLQTSAWGWHQETAVHFLHLVLSGTLDRYPTLQFILGHRGEMVPFYLDRLDEALPQALTRLDRTIPDYVRENVYITPSGMFNHAQLQYCIETVGAERILYSVDYPFIGNDEAASFLTEANLSEEAKHQIAHQNAENLLGL
ncbi:amidohydrolase family protein [Rhodococcus rhodochrous]|uniref:amidohydrolase family protein n=1 Tax=Rhodococcus rhodochrous TaxID=1829 RepID=UPI001E4ECEBB|nr:amidohydrolase family protein [Rhodococcus rhodochrous]MCB8913904.1 amidohydrolase family protein [Rhodococcus rhodochrous]